MTLKLLPPARVGGRGENANDNRVDRRKKLWERAQQRAVYTAGMMEWRPDLAACCAATLENPNCREAASPKDIAAWVEVDDSWFLVQVVTATELARETRRRFCTDHTLNKVPGGLVATAHALLDKVKMQRHNVPQRYARTLEDLVGLTKRAIENARQAAPEAWEKQQAKELGTEEQKGDQRRQQQQREEERE